MNTEKKTASSALVALFLLLGGAGQAQETIGAPPALQNSTQQRSADATTCAALSINGIYSGTIGDRQVVLEIGAVSENRNVSDETRLRDGSLAPNQTLYPLEGRYFDRQQGLALLVEGRPLPDGSVRIREYKSNFPTGDEWRLNFTGDHAEGSFCQCNVGQTDEMSKPRLKIELNRVSKGFDPNFDWLEPPDKAFYDLLLDFPLKNGREVRVNRQMAYVVQTDARFDVNMPRITRFPDKAIMEKVNISLEAELEYRRLWAANCAQAYFGVPGGVGETLHVVLTRNILRIRRESTYSCGWPAPKSDVTTLIFNMHTGESRGSL
jgi:hypothetical protein